MLIILRSSAKRCHVFGEAVCIHTRMLYCKVALLGGWVVESLRGRSASSMDELNVRCRSIPGMVTPLSTPQPLQNSTNARVSFDGSNHTNSIILFLRFQGLKWKPVNYHWMFKRSVFNKAFGCSPNGLVLTVTQMRPQRIPTALQKIGSFWKKNWEEQESSVTEGGY